MIGLVRSARELRALLDEIAEIDWRHPAWWTLVAATAAFERWPVRAERDVEDDYVTSDGGPGADTFMARPRPLADAARELAAAVVGARAALDALDALDGSLPGQPLRRQLDRRGRLARRRQLARPRRVVFATPTGAYGAELAGDPSADVELVRELARACVRAPASARRLERVASDDDRPLDAALGVSLAIEEPSTARHAHRRCWNAGGGPWLGLARTPELAAVTTSHLVVDGYGHALIARAVFAGVDAGVPDTLIAAARRELAGAALPPAAVLAEARPLGVAVADLDARPSFAELLYATAWASERAYRRHWSDAARARARFSPTVQIPIAPGDRRDPDRARRRVVPGLVALRMRDGELESPEALRARLGALLAREAACAGVLGRMREAALRMPLPSAFKRRSVAAGGAPHRLLPPVEVLAGRSCISALAFPRGDEPADSIYAVSAPALDASPADPRGGTVVTVVHTAVAISGTGLAGTAAGARAFLDDWRTGLDWGRSQKIKFRARNLIF